jgi:hypothetical protein
MKNLIKLLMCLVISSVANAEEITFSNIYPPGGSTDIVVTAISDNLEKQGETVNRQYFKSCYDAIQYMNSNPKNNLIILDYEDMVFGNLNKGAKCPPQVDYKNKISIYSSVYEFSYGLVSVPGFTGTSYPKLKELSSAGTKIRIGYSVGPYNTYMVKLFASRNPSINFVLLPYAGTGALRPAYLAKDFDLYYGSGLKKEMIERGGVLIASAKRNIGVTFMGDLAEPEFIKNEFPEHQTGVMLVTSNLSSTSQDKIASALKSIEAVNALKKIDATATGIAYGVSANETLKRVIDFEKKLEQISK